MSIFNNTSSLVLALIASLFLAPNNISAQKVLIYSDHQSSNEMRTKFLKDVFFPAIEKESNGRLKVEAHWDGELAIAYEAFGAVKSGDTVDIATVVPEYTAEELPLHQMFKGFPVGPSGKTQVSFFRKVYSELPEFSEELTENNMVQIFLGTGYPVGFFSRQPLNSLTDIKESKWRSASFWHLDFLRNAGAIPIRMHWGQEIYEALKEKSLDGIMVNIDSGYNLKIYEHAPYLLASKNLWLGHLYLVAINKNTWNELTNEDKEAIQRAAETSYKTLGNVMDMSFYQQMELLKKEGTTIRILNKEEIRQFKMDTKFEKVQKHWVDEQKKNGVIEASLVLKKIKKILKDTI